MVSSTISFLMTSIFLFWVNPIIPVVVCPFHNFSSLSAISQNCGLCQWPFPHQFPWNIGGICPFSSWRFYNRSYTTVKLVNHFQKPDKPRWPQSFSPLISTDLLPKCHPLLLNRHHLLAIHCVFCCTAENFYVQVFSAHQDSTPGRLSGSVG